MKFFSLIFSFLSLFCAHSYALSLDEILFQTEEKSLHLHLKSQRQALLMDKSCEAEKKLFKIPLSCYQNSDGKFDDFWCLRLKSSHLQLQSIERALLSKKISVKCKKHLEGKKNLLIYRKIDLIFNLFKKRLDR